ncbi:hypothetical protein [Comamonas sp. GB3 AK4-5]|uniref:hypothetical protein n=1 Tax=Comamonas sp. GB3 AK4-5 TaxID=3231487 RepID=UPI00351E12B3
MSVPSVKRDELPYTLLLDPLTGTAAAYTNRHQLIAESASEKLIQYALDNTSKSVPFDRKLHQPDSEWRQLPVWATEDVFDRLKIVWIKRPHGDAPEEVWGAIPRH